MLSAIADAILDGLKYLFCLLLYTIMKIVLYLAGMIEKFFNVFAGTENVFIKEKDVLVPTSLLDLLLGYEPITNVFFGMMLIGFACAFGFAIFAVARKTIDFAEAGKKSIGQILGQFFRAMLIILLMNIMCLSSIRLANKVLDQINYVLINAEYLDTDGEEKTFSDTEFAEMAKLLAVIGNASINPTESNRYNINMCFNQIRPKLLAMSKSGWFKYQYAPDSNGHHSWQSALALIATSADLTVPRELDQPDDAVTAAILAVQNEIKTYPGFKPVKQAKLDKMNTKYGTDVMIFLISSMGAERSSTYRDGNFTDALRRNYITGKRNYRDIDDVQEDFKFTSINYLVAIIAAFVYARIMVSTLLVFVTRMFNLVLLYLVAPLFVAPMPLDEGNKFNSWLQSFTIQLFSGFGCIVVMRLYLLVLPVIASGNLIFFQNEAPIMNYMAQLIIVLGGAYAILNSSTMITGILAGNAGMAALQSEGAASGLVGSVMNASNALGLTLGAGRLGIRGTGAALNMAKAGTGFGKRTAQRIGNAFSNRNGTLEGDKVIGKGGSDSSSAPRQSRSGSEKSENGNLTALSAYGKGGSKDDFASGPSNRPRLERPESEAGSRSKDDSSVSPSRRMNLDNFQSEKGGSSVADIKNRGQFGSVKPRQRSGSFSDPTNRRPRL